MALYVPDASFILGWGVDEDAFESRAKVVERMAREGGIVPSLWRLEVANALLMGVRRPVDNGPGTGGACRYQQAWN